MDARAGASRYQPSAYGAGGTRKPAEITELSHSEVFRFFFVFVAETGHDEANVRVGTLDGFQRAVELVAIVGFDVAPVRFRSDPDGDLITGISGVARVLEPATEIFGVELGTNLGEHSFPGVLISRAIHGVLRLMIEGGYSSVSSSSFGLLVAKSSMSGIGSSTASAS